MIVGRGAMIMLSRFVAVAEATSVTFTVKLKVPAAVGVPLMVPAGLSDRPPGNAPLATVVANV